MELNEIYLGDSYELIKQVPDKSVDLIVTDPPYEFPTGDIGTGIFKYRNSPADAYREIRNNNIAAGISLAILPELVRVMKKINIYLWCNKEQLLDYMKFFVEEKGCNFEIFIWAKNNPPPFLNGHYLKDKEYCLYFWEKGVKIKPSYETGRTVYFSNLNLDDKKKYGHPTIKPLDIIQNLIQNSMSDCAGGVVFDPFLGSGTTAVAARNLGFNYLGFEINETYFKIAKDRLAGIEKSGQMQLF